MGVVESEPLYFRGYEARRRGRFAARPHSSAHSKRWPRRLPDPRRLAIGSAGYHLLGGLPWLDAALNAAMILTGMGPVQPISTPPAKVFAIGYALFSGVFFLTVVAVLLAPALQHFLHRFHLKLS